jgi:kynurenine formamidase
MLGAGAVFVECCTNLRALAAGVVDFCALPLNVIAGDGAPCRVAAFER